MLNPDDFDVHPLNKEDFVEDLERSGYLLRYPYTDPEVSFMMEQTKVMEAQHHIHSHYFIKQRLQPQMTGSIAEREAFLGSSSVNIVRRISYPESFRDHGLLLCKQWLKSIPETVKYDVDDVQNHQFWLAFLHILY
jgi:hypothetical protein